MDQNHVEDQPEQAKPESSEQSQMPSPSVPPSTSEKADKQKPGRFQRILRAVLIWLVVMALLFMAGILTDETLRYKPLAETMSKAQSDLGQANQDISNLQAEVDRLKATNQAATNQINSLESDNKALQNELDTANTHLELYQVLVDVTDARLALSLNDVEGAKAALANTAQLLDNLLPFITKFDPNLAKSMPQRLDLIVTGLDRDIETAKIDLELFSKDLLVVDSSMFPR
jgi:FtsZ-binding cell division protein ZapB